jgi:hypothetical protein
MRGAQRTRDGGAHLAEAARSGRVLDLACAASRADAIGDAIRNRGSPDLRDLPRDVRPGVTEAVAERDRILSFLQADAHACLVLARDTAVGPVVEDRAARSPAKSRLTANEPIRLLASEHRAHGELTDRAADLVARRTRLASICDVTLAALRSVHPKSRSAR